MLACVHFSHRGRSAELSWVIRTLRWRWDDVGALLTFSRNKQLTVAQIHCCTDKGGELSFALCDRVEESEWRNLATALPVEEKPKTTWLSGDGESSNRDLMVQYSQGWSPFVITTSSLTSVNFQMEGLLQLLAKLCDERDVQVCLFEQLEAWLWSL